MKKTTAIILCINGTALLLVGCGGQPTSAPPTAKPPRPEMSTPPAPPAASAASALAVAPPPPPSGAPTQPVAAAQPGSDMVDETGKQLTAVQFVQQAVGQYERLRPMHIEGDQPKWPPLRDLSQLVKVGLVKSLPQAPPGKKFVLDPQTMKVSLANQ